MALDNISREHQTVQWLTMGAIGVAVALLVYGAFLGATRAQHDQTGQKVRRLHEACYAAAFVLLSLLRRHLSDTELADAQVGTIQRKLLKLGVLVKEACRRVGLPFDKLTALSTPKGALLVAAPHSSWGRCCGSAPVRGTRLTDR